MTIKPFVLLVAAGLAFASCDSNKTDSSVTETSNEAVSVDTVAKIAATDGNAVVVSVDEVPDTIRTSFTTKYPKIKTVTWNKYTPGTNDDFEMDQTYYYVRYNNDGKDYITWYDNRGEWVKTSTRIAGHKDLPAAVNDYITANYPGYEISEIDHSNDKDRELYELELNKGDNKVKLKISPSGEILKKK